jgi:hypothetical protein
VTIDTGAFVTVAKPDITAGLPERELSMHCALLTASGETILVLKQPLVKLTEDAPTHNFDICRQYN